MTKKLVLTQKQMISTCERHAEHWLAGRNTQQFSYQRLVLKSPQKEALKQYRLGM